MRFLIENYHKLNLTYKIGFAINIGMGIKISSLPNNALPYTGSEKIPLVQTGQTRAGTLSSFVNYLSGALLSDSELRALSGNWQNTYTTFRANSANYAVTNATNTFSELQIFNDQPQFLQGILVGNATTIYEINDTLPSTSVSITLGAGGGNYIGLSPLVYEGNTLIGTDAGVNAGNDQGRVGNNIAIGATAGTELGAGGNGHAYFTTSIGYAAGVGIGAYNSSVVNDTSDTISIGTNAGSYIGSGQTNSDGSAKHIVSIGSGAGAYIGASTSSDLIGGFSNAFDIVAIGQNAGIYAGSSRYGGGIGNAGNIISIGQNAGSYVGSSSDQSSVAGNATGIIAIGTDSAYQAGVGGVDNEGSISNSIFIGLSSGYTSGVGGFTNGSVDNMIAIGREAGFQSGYQTTSNNNIYIGLSSGYNKQGSRNTFIGDLTNTSPTTTTSLSGCIAIGYGATPTARNTIAIGSASTPLSVVPGRAITASLSGLRVMINGTYYTIPLLA
jgi:hypothetical protein